MDEEQIYLSGLKGSRRLEKSAMKVAERCESRELVWNYPRHEMR